MNSNITQWAIRHGVSAQALLELEVMFGMSLPAGIDATGDSESAVQANVRLEAAKKGIRLFRNNVGVLRDEKGRPVRYGLANDSKRVNEQVKSGDLIGWKPVRITHAHVGQVIGQFVSRECKNGAWQYSGSGREQAQLAWIQLVLSGGGDAAFCTGTGSL